jgi:hypothetical protein
MVTNGPSLGQEFLIDMWAEITYPDSQLRCLYRLQQLAKIPLPRDSTQDMGYWFGACFATESVPQFGKRQNALNNKRDGFIQAISILKILINEECLKKRKDNESSPSKCLKNKEGKEGKGRKGAL